MDYAPPRRPCYPQPEEIGRLLIWVATASAEEFSVVIRHPGLENKEGLDRMKRELRVLQTLNLTERGHTSQCPSREVVPERRLGPFRPLPRPRGARSALAARRAAR